MLLSNVFVACSTFGIKVTNSKMCAMAFKERTQGRDPHCGWLRLSNSFKIMLLSAKIQSSDAGP